MELVKSSVGVVFPLFFMMAVGFVIKRLGLVSREGLAEINRLNVRVFLPAMLFANICEGDIVHGTDSRFFLFTTVAAVIIFFLCITIIPKIVKDKNRSQSIILGIYRPNTAIYGLPLAQSILSNNEKVSNVLMMISISILVTNFFAVLVIEIFKGDKPKIFTSIVHSLSNPIVVGLLLGLFMQFMPFSISRIILLPIKNIGAITTPLAFICLGADFNIKTGRKNIAAVSLATLLKLVITPLIVAPIAAILLGMRDEVLVAILCSFATPTAVSVLPLIKEVGADDELMGEIIVSTTAFSLVSIFLFVYLFKYLLYF